MSTLEDERRFYEDEIRPRMSWVTGELNKALEPLGLRIAFELEDSE